MSKKKTEDQAKEEKNLVAGTPEDTPDFTAKEVEKREKAARDEIEQETRDYWLNIAFDEGNQWVDWNNKYTEIEFAYDKRTTKRKRPVDNRILPAKINTISRLMKAQLTFEVPAQGPDDFALQGAETAEAVLREKKEKDEWEDLRESLATTILLGGTGAIVTDWDPKAHQYATDVTTGDTESTVLSIADFALEPGVLNVRKARWWVRTEVMTPEAAQAKFGLKKPPKSDSLGSTPFRDGISRRFASSEGVKVIYYYERPNHMCTEGRTCVVINGEFVWGPKPWPFANKERLNLTVGRCIVVDGKWAGMTPVTAAREPQRQINSLWAKMHETTHRTVGAKLMLDARHNELNNQLDDDPLKPIILNAVKDAKEPKYIDPPVLPNYVVKQLEMLYLSLDNIMGVHDISRGQTPQNAPDSGYGLSLLAEQDATPAGRLAKELAKMFGFTATFVLECYADRVKDTRKAVVAGGRGITRTYAWKGDVIKEQTRAIVPPDSIIPRNDAANQERAMTMLKMRPDWFKTFADYARLAQSPGADDMISQMDDDIARAEWENSRMAMGELTEVFDFDNHTKHIATHNHFRKSPAYINLKSKDREVFDLHIANHQAMAAEEAGQQAKRAQLDAAMAAAPLGNEAPPLGMGAPVAGAPGGDAQAPTQDVGQLTPQIPEGM